MKSKMKPSKNIEDVRAPDAQREKLRAVTTGNSRYLDKAWNEAMTTTSKQKATGRALGLGPEQAALQNQANKLEAKRRTRISNRSH